MAILPTAELIARCWRRPPALGDVGEMCGRTFVAPVRLPIGHWCPPQCLVCSIKAFLFAHLQAHGRWEIIERGLPNPGTHHAYRALAELVVEGLADDVVEPDGRVLLVLTAKGSRR